MADYGLLSTGFSRKRLSDIKAELENDFRVTLGNQINLLPTSVFGQIIGLFSEREDALWELAESIYFSAFPQTASGVSLDNVMSILGLSRLEEKKTIQQNLTMFGLVGTSIPAGTQFFVSGAPDAIFTTQSSVVLGIGELEVQTIATGVGPSSGNFKLQFVNEVTSILPYNAIAADIQTALNALPKIASVGGVTVTGTMASNFVITFQLPVDVPMIEVVDSTLNLTLTISETQKGIAQSSSDAEASIAGPIAAPQYTLTGIVTPIAGLTSVVNLVDAVVGREVETDAAFRARALTGQNTIGRGTPEALRARLLEVLGVTQVIVFENDTDSVDVHGLPPHSFRAFVQGGDDQDIFDAIWLNKPAGIYPDGSIVGTVIDTQGLSKTVRFERPVVSEVYIYVSVVTDSSFPADGEDQIRTALADFVNSLDIGQKLIVYPKLISSLNGIPGIVDIEISVDTTPLAGPGPDANITPLISEILKVIDPDTDIVVSIT